MTSVDPQILLAQTAWLRRLARQLVGDPHVADDVVQDTWVAALEHPPREVHAEGRLRGWLASVARNAARMRQRGDARRTARERAVARTAHVPPTSDSDEVIAAQQRLLEAVMALPAADREVVVLRYFEGMAPRAIARRLGCTSTAVRSRLSRALGVLRARLAPRESDRRALALALLPLLDGRGATATGLTVGGSWLMKTTTKAMIAALAAGGAAATWLLWGQGAVPGDPVALPEPERVVATNAESGEDESDEQTETLSSEPARTVVQAAPARKTAAPETTIVVIGRCVDADGRPIEGAQLIAIHVKGHPAATSDSEGRVRLEIDWPAELTRGNRHWIVVDATAEGLTRSRRQEMVQGRGLLEIALGDLVLTPGGTLAGSVRDVDGTPAQGAFVGVVQGATPSKGVTEERRLIYGVGFTGLEGVWWVNTDEDGRYRFEGLPVGSVSVVARHSSRLCAYTPPVQVIAGGEVEAPVLSLGSVPPENLITGEVRDEDGQPVPGVHVSVYENRGPRNIDPETRARTDKDGSFEAKVLAGQEYTLRVEKLGPGRRQMIVHDVAAGTRDLVIGFPELRRFEIAVTGRGGAPVKPTAAGAYDANGVYLLLDWEEGPEGERIPLVPDQEFTLWVRADGYLEKRVGPFQPEDVRARIEVELEPAGMVSGLVVAGGQPVAGAVVHAHLVNPRQRYHYFAHEIYTRLEAALRKEVKTDENGRFALPIVREGTYVLHAEADGWARGATRELQLAPAAGAPAVEIALQAPATVEGRVIAGPHASAEGQVVAATCGDGHAEVCVTDAEGRFRFEGLAPGGWQVRPARPDDQEWLRMARTWPEYQLEELPVDVQLHAGQTAAYDIDLRSRYSAELQGRLAIDGVACGGWRVSLWSAGRFVFTKTAADGRFQQRGSTGDTSIYFFGHLPAGGQLQVQQQLPLADGPNVVDVHVRTGGVELVDLPASAPPPEDDRSEGYALVWAKTGRGPHFVYRFDPGADGRHHAPALPVGRAELRRRENDRTHIEGWKPIAEVDIVAGELRRVTLQ